LATKIVGYLCVQILSLSPPQKFVPSQIMWLLPILPEFFYATNDHLKKKRLFSLSFIYARCQSLFYTDLFSAIVGKMGSSAGFSVVYVYTAELFPTQVHNHFSFF
jgi:hypothetical protein